MRGAGTCSLRRRPRDFDSPALFGTRRGQQLAGALHHGDADRRDLRAIPAGIGGEQAVAGVHEAAAGQRIGGAYDRCELDQRDLQVSARGEGGGDDQRHVDSEFGCERARACRARQRLSQYAFGRRVRQTCARLWGRRPRRN